MTRYLRSKIETVSADEVVNTVTTIMGNQPVNDSLIDEVAKVLEIVTTRNDISITDTADGVENLSMQIYKTDETTVEVTFSYDSEVIYRCSFNFSKDSEEVRLGISDDNISEDKLYLYDNTDNPSEYTSSMISWLNHILSIFDDEK